MPRGKRECGSKMMCRTCFAKMERYIEYDLLDGKVRVFRVCRECRYAREVWVGPLVPENEEKMLALFYGGNTSETHLIY